MRKITIICKNDSRRRENRLPLYFQGWLMARIDESYAEKLHRFSVNPYTIYVRTNKDEIHFTVSLLTEEAIEKIGSILLHTDLKEIYLESTAQKTYKIIKRTIEESSQSELIELFYQERAPQVFTVKFLSPTSFKSNGEYVFFPDITMILQSIMRRYHYIFEETERIDVDLLEELYNQTKIVSYRIASSYHPVHKTFIPGFKGEIRLHCRGNQTLANYLSMLLEFANYAGIGIKTSMGMGAVEARPVEKGEKNGRKTS